MTEFTLDTSGVVSDVPGHAFDGLGWGYLDAFTQGYIEALVASIGAEDDDPGSFASDSAYALDGRVRVGFSDLAPETLARIIADCAEHPGNDKLICTTTRQHDNGARFWRIRSRGEDSAFPPLTPYLGDDGRVYLREGV